MRLHHILLLTVVAGASAGCTPKPQPVRAEPPATVQSPAISGVSGVSGEATPPPEAPPAPTSVPGTAAETVVVIDPGEDEAGSPATLVQAARAERQRRANAPKPVAVITNQTVSNSKGQLTSAEPGTTGGSGTKSQPDPQASQSDEHYWRRGALDLRLRWRRALDDIATLERSAENFRRRFYAEDDPYVRDGQVKPAWDRVLDQLRQAREDAVTNKEKLDSFLEEGHRAGALPGWLREGIEHEPEPEPAAPPPGEPVEPQVLDEGKP